MVNMKKKIVYLLLTLCSFSGAVYSDFTWSAPTPISTPLTNATEPHTVIDGSGNATAVWVENNTIKASTLPFGGSWGAPVTLSNVVNTSSTPRIGIDGSGNVTAIWIENTKIESATMPSGGSWSTETLPISDSGASSPSLAVDATGNAVAIWTRSGSIESSTRISGTWNLVRVLSAANSSNPHVSISSFGTAMACWHSVVSGTDVIVTDILTVSTNTWAASQNVFPGTAAFHHNYPKIGLDSFGNASITWFRYNLVDGNSYQNVQVISSSLTQGAANWGIPQILSNPGIRNPQDLALRIKFDSSGDGLIIWTNSYDGRIFNVESSQRLFGTSIWPIFVQPQGPSLYSFGIDAAVASGTALLTNMAWDGASMLFIEAQQTDTTNPLEQFWSVPTTISTGNDNGYPSCALGSSSSTLYAVTVWLNFDGSNTVINATVGTEALIDPPSNVNVTQSSTDFGVYTDYANTITWDPSSDPNLQQYNLYRNGVFFAQTDPSTLQFIDNNEIQGGTVTYGVAALTTQFRQSEIVQFTLNP